MFALLLSLPAAAEESVLARFRPASDPESTERGWTVAFDAEGFTLQRFGSARRERVQWADVTPEDRAALRRRCGLDGGNKPGAVKGVRHEGLLLPDPEDRIERIEEIQVNAQDAYDGRQLYLRELARELGIVKRAMRLDRNYARAEQRLGRLLRRHPGRRSLIRTQDELRAGKRVWPQKRFHAVKNQGFKRVTQKHLSGKAQSIDQAMAWARSGLGNAVKARVIRRMGLTEDEFRAFSATRPRISPHYANYWSGTFVIEKRAQKGAWSRRRVRGDPNRWWFAYSDVGPRGAFLRAYAAEHNPQLFEVVSVRLAPCEKCGGVGRIRHASLRGLKALDGGHVWLQTCPRCYGARNDRIVAYR